MFQSFFGALEQLYLHRWSLNAQQAGCRTKVRQVVTRIHDIFQTQSEKKRQRALHKQLQNHWPWLFPKNTAYMKFILYGRHSFNSQNLMPLKPFANATATANILAYYKKSTALYEVKNVQLLHLA